MTPNATTFKDQFAELATITKAQGLTIMDVVATIAVSMATMLAIRLLFGLIEVLG